MIEKRAHDGFVVEVTFVVPAVLAEGDVGVAGEFNDWDPSATRLESHGEVRTATVVLKPGRDYAFRYCADDGRWFNDEAADRYEPNEFGGHNGIIDLTAG